MSQESKLNYFIPIFVFLLMVYRSSWFPGASVLFGKEVYLITFAFILIFTLNFNFENFLKYVFLKQYYLRTSLIIIIAMILFSTLFYNFQELSQSKYFYRFTAYLATLYIYLYIFPKYLVSSKINLTKFIYFVSLFGIVLAIFGFITINSHSIGKFSGMLVSFITHPNNTSIIFTLSVPATMFLYFKSSEESTSAKKYFYLLSIIIQLAAQLFTYTRAGIIATFIGVIIFLILKYKGKILWYLPIALPLIHYISRIFQCKGYGIFF